MSALTTPALTLAQDLRTGKLGGVCFVVGSDDNSGDAMPAGAHCDACGSQAMHSPPLLAQVLPSQPERQASELVLSFYLASRIGGLPPSRGPPAL